MNTALQHEYACHNREYRIVVFIPVSIILNAIKYRYNLNFLVRSSSDQPPLTFTQSVSMILFKHFSISVRASMPMLFSFAPLSPITIAFCPWRSTKWSHQYTYMAALNDLFFLRLLLRF